MLWTCFSIVSSFKFYLWEKFIPLFNESNPYNRVHSHWLLGDPVPSTSPLSATSLSLLAIAFLPLSITVNAEVQPHVSLRIPEHGEGESQ